MTKTVDGLHCEDIHLPVQVGISGKRRARLQLQGGGIVELAEGQPVEAGMVDDRNITAARPEGEDGRLIPRQHQRGVTVTAPVTCKRSLATSAQQDDCFVLKAIRVVSVKL
jgi:hypothetical protein